jgi:hypothetical protein
MLTRHIDESIYFQINPRHTRDGPKQDCTAMLWHPLGLHLIEKR